jgi:hypothetical protein
MTDETCWTFYGYVTPAGSLDVQDWFMSLLPEERDEAKDVLGYLQQLPSHLWVKPDFEKLDHDISEIRFKVNVLHVQRIYRVYGAFWPEKRRHSYTFLIGKDKKVDNDRRGKNEAIKRLKELRSRKATIRKFEFEEGVDSETSTGERSPQPIR